MIDAYTKIILSIIAASLVVIAARGVVYPSRADDDFRKVVLCDGERCLKLDHRGEHTFIPTISYQPDIQ